MPHERASTRAASRLGALPIALAGFATLAVAGCGGAMNQSTAPSPTTPAGSGLPAPDTQLLSVLQQSWEGYKQAFVGRDGRVSDPTRGGITTSEGQSYALLRAAWQGDRPAFDAVWRWTAANLQVRGDGLFASLWGGGVVPGHNTATHATSDIALALLFAQRRFRDTTYDSAALTVLSGMWQHDVTSLNGMNVVT